MRKRWQVKDLTDLEYFLHEDEKHMKALQHAAQQVLGEEIEVRCFTSGGGGGIPPEIDSAGRVAAAMRLGGKIVDVNDLSASGTADE